MAVYVAQALCPQQHLLIGVASETDRPRVLRQILRRALAKAIAAGVFNPWCGLCGSRIETWRYDVRATAFATLEAAESALKTLEAEQRELRTQLDAEGRTYRPGSQN